jgi:hypothetical protein
MAIASAFTPTGIVRTTVLEPVSITDTDLEPAFVTYARDPFGVIATPAGFIPTGTVAITVLVAAAMIETEFEKVFATNTRDPSGLTASP